MSICIRNGVQYKRHCNEPELVNDKPTGRLICKHCDHIKGTHEFKTTEQPSVVEGSGSNPSAPGVSETHDLERLADDGGPVHE